MTLSGLKQRHKNRSLIEKRLARYLIKSRGFFEFEQDMFKKAKL